jgi:hypothetical protein
MNPFGKFPSRHLRLGLIGILIASCACGGWLWHSQAEAAQAPVPAPTQATAPLSADDVSILFPPPTREEDFAKLIEVRDLTSQDGHAVWTNGVFKRFLEIAASTAAKVSGPQNRIGLPSEAQSIDSWFIAGIRIDAGAPGLSNDIRGQFGQSPEIRLIIQPVTRGADGTPKVDDIAAHLIFNFTTLSTPPQTGCLPRRVPDLDSFNAIVRDLVALRNKLSTGQLGSNKVATSGVPLGVHPGLADPTTEINMRQEIKSFLERHISNQKLDAMAIAGLPAGAPAPWIFLSMAIVPAGVDPALPNGGFDAVHGPTLDGQQQFAQMLEPFNNVLRVVPDPHTNNLNPITCKNAAVPANPPILERRGVSTAAIFANPSTPPDKAKEILDVIADPTKSHFFNTDCISCHTETQLTMKQPNFNGIPGIDSAVLPKDSWNVRNFGWSPAGALQPTVTRRTANETAAVVTYINSEILPKLAQGR